MYNLGKHEKSKTAKKMMTTIKELGYILGFIKYKMNEIFLKQNFNIMQIGICG